MKKNTVIIITGLVILLILAGITFGTEITGFIVKKDKDAFGDEGQAYKVIGNHFAEKGDYGEAIIAYENCLIYQEDQEARNNLAVLYHKKAEYSNAIEHLRILIKQYPDNPLYHYDLAINLVDRFRNSEEQRVQDLVDALAEYKKVVELEPGYAHTKQNIEVLNKILKLE